MRNKICKICGKEHETYIQSQWKAFTDGFDRDQLTVLLSILIFFWLAFNFWTALGIVLLLLFIDGAWGI